VLAALRLVLTLVTYVAVIYTRALGALARALLLAGALVGAHAALRAAPSEAGARGPAPGVPFVDVLGLRRRPPPAPATAADGGRGVGIGWLRLRRRWGRARGAGPGGLGPAEPHPDPRRLFRELGAGGRALAAAAGETAWAGAAAGWRGTLAWLQPGARSAGALGGGAGANGVRLW